MVAGPFRNIYQQKSPPRQCFEFFLVSFILETEQRFICEITFQLAVLLVTITATFCKLSLWNNLSLWDLISFKPFIPYSRLLESIPHKKKYAPIFYVILQRCNSFQVNVSFLCHPETLEKQKFSRILRGYGESFT